MNVMDKWKMILQPQNIDERYIDVFSQYCEKHSKMSALESMNTLSATNTLPISIDILKTLTKMVKNIEIVIDNGNVVDDTYLVSTPFSHDYMPSEGEVLRNLSNEAVNIIKKRLIETRSNRIYISHMLVNNLRPNKEKMVFELALRFATN